MKFRADINGLRAIAVIAVVLFHFNPSILSGGFAGVDVFFVISGYLMTAIIVTGLEDDRLSIIDFYLARCRRIIPALAFLCFIVSIFGWFYLPPFDYEVLGKHLLSSLSFFSNVIYWQEAGYFDAASHEKWLLHTWSLSTEWQFYLLYPLVLSLLWKLTSPKVTKRLFLLAIPISFFVCIIASYKWPSLAFYLLPTRAWEMLMGGIAFLFPLTISSSQKRVLLGLGLLLIIFSYFWISVADIWPGYLALIPTLGTLLVIWACDSKSLVLNNFIIQWIGKISYSLYLWHWPIVVAILYFSFDSQISIYVGIAISLLCASFSYYFVENYSKNTFFKLGLNSTGMAKASLMFSGFILLFSAIYYFEGVVWRNDRSLIFAQQKEINSDWSYPKSNFRVMGLLQARKLAGNSNIKTLFIGDSLIEQYYPRIEELKKSNSIVDEVLFITNGGCFPTVKIVSFKRECKNLNKLEEYLKHERFEKIIVGGDWYTRFQRDEWFVNNGGNLMPINSEPGKSEALLLFDEFFAMLASRSKKVYVVLQVPIGQLFDHKYIARQQFIGNAPLTFYSKDYFSSKYKAFNTSISKVAQKNGAIIIDPVEYLCSHEKCSTVDDNGEMIYKDNKHFRASYMRKEVLYLDQIFE